MGTRYNYFQFVQQWLLTLKTELCNCNSELHNTGFSIFNAFGFHYNRYDYGLCFTYQNVYKRVELLAKLE